MVHARNLSEDNVPSPVRLVVILHIPKRRRRERRPPCAAQRMHPQMRHKTPRLLIEARLLVVVVRLLAARRHQRELQHSLFNDMCDLILVQAVDRRRTCHTRDDVLQQGRIPRGEVAVVKVRRDPDRTHTLATRLGNALVHFKKPRAVGHWGTDNRGRRFCAPI